MKYSLRKILANYKNKGSAVGHFNASELSQLNGIVSAGMNMKAPIIIGVSEGEREFWGVKQIADIIKSIRDEYNIPLFLNADHTHSFYKIKEAVEAGFDAVLFDGSGLNFKKNIEETKKVVSFIRQYNKKYKKDVLVEGEIGYIGLGSQILRKMPKGVEIDEGSITKIDEAKEFVGKTGIDLFAPAVGNIHGMFKNASNPKIQIKRVNEISAAIGIPLVLHGGSGIRDNDFKKSIKAGITIVHISTLLRLGWWNGVKMSIKSQKNQLAPYYLLAKSVDMVKKETEKKIKLFKG